MPNKYTIELSRKELLKMRGQLRTEVATLRQKLESARVSLAEIALTLNGSDAPHPEEYCEICSRRNVTWVAPSPLWNAVLRNPATGQDSHGVICPSCFSVLALKKLRCPLFRLTVEGLDLQSLWQDHDGRIWNDQTYMWEEPTPKQVSE